MASSVAGTGEGEAEAASRALTIDRQWHDAGVQAVVFAGNQLYVGIGSGDVHLCKCVDTTQLL